MLHLSCDQISHWWGSIREVLEFIAPPHEDVTEEGARVLLEQLMSETAQVWVPTEGGEVKGMLITMVRREFMLNTLNLYVMAAYSYTGVSNELWQKTLDTIRKFALGQGCVNIVGHTQVERIKDVVKMLGGDVSTTLIQLKVSV